MTNDFQSLSNEIANDFLQSVIFIDDEAYEAPDEEDPQHDFDAQRISRNFAHNNQICSVFKPETESDIQLFSKLAQKADVTVLDWRIMFDQPEEVTEADDDEDDDIDDIRGIYTKNIISNLLKSAGNQNSLKFILVYTGELHLNSIAEDILADLSTKNINGFSIPDSDDCCVLSDNCKILVRLKANGGETKGKLNPSLLNKDISYDDLPEFINTEYSKMTAGLMSNFALKSLTAIRKNSHQILNVFSKKLDTAYLTNQSLLVNTDDANELLVELIGDTFTSILRANNLSRVLDDNFISLWLDENIKNINKPKYDKKGKKTTDSYVLDKDIIKELLKPYSNVEKKFSDVLNQKVGISKSSVSEKDNYKKYAFDLFQDDTEKESINTGFTNLCQHKNLIHHEGHIPTLSLGTIVRSSLCTEKYLVCIQQRCDSVRIKETEDRRFLFLSLSVTKDNKKFDFITSEGLKLTLDRQTYHLRTVKFNGSADGTVKAEDNDGCYLFKQLHSSKELVETFEFMFELKDLYAQRIVADYSSSLSRVGLDEPEWVRLS